MPSSVHYLTDSDVRKLNRLYERVENLEKIIGRDDIPIPIHQAPEVYVADVPAGGIPGLTLPDKPGSATCDIYKINVDVSPEVLVEVVDLSKTVYNLSTTDITEEWVQVTRSKFGAWLASIGGGGGTQSEFIRFKIESVTDYTAEVNITARICGKLTVSEENGGQVIVHDPCQCFLDEPIEDLIGRCGGARYMDPTGQLSTGTGTVDTETGTGTGVTACRWEIDWLCCPSC